MNSELIKRLKAEVLMYKYLIKNCEIDATKNEWSNIKQFIEGKKDAYKDFVACLENIIKEFN